MMTAIENEHAYGLHIRESATDGSDFANADADYRRLFLGEDGLLHLKDSAGTVTDIAASGNVATDAIWDAAGDLAVGSGANTAARLAIGAAGGALSRVNGAVAWNSGTANPTGATGDRYWRTDLGLEIYYDGTRWLTTQLFREPFGTGNTVTPDTVGTALGRMAPWGTAYDLWLVSWDTTTYVATTNDGTKYWTLTLAKVVANDTPTNIDQYTTAADTVNSWTHHRRALGVSYVAATYFEIFMTGAKTSTPGGLYWGGALEYRLIVT
jgi:hypothetical protein